MSLLDSSFIAPKAAEPENLLPVKLEAAPVVRKFDNSPLRLLEALAAPAAPSVEECARRDERLQFCRLVLAKQAEVPHLNRKEACDLVAVAEAGRFPHLLQCGKNGTSALNYDNCRRWLEKLGKRPDGRYNLENAGALLENWTKGPRKVRGCFEFWRIFFACYLSLNRLDMTVAHRIAADWLRKYRPEEPPPSLSMCDYVIRRKLPKSAVELARMGESYYNQCYLDYTSRDPDSIRANEAWVADNRVLDVLARVPDGKGGWKPDRLWVTLILDVKTWHVVSAQVLWHEPNNTDIRNGLADGIDQFGRPEYFYIDNGRDFKAKGFSTPVIFTPKINGSEVYSHSILQQLSIRVVIANPYNARPKVIERFYKEMAGKYDKLREAYLGNRPAARPETAALYYKPENIELLPSVQDVAADFNSFLERYHHTAGHGKYLNGLTPAEAFSEERRISRPKLSREELAVAFLKPMPQTRKVEKRGPAVQYGKLRYVAVDPNLLEYYVDREVMVKFDNVDSTRLFAFTLEGKFITECRTVDYLPYFADTPEDRAKISEAESNHYGRRKRADSLIRMLTGGFNRLAARHLANLSPELLANPDVLRAVAENRSVKGLEHHHKVYSLDVPKTGDAVPDRTEPDFARQAAERRKKLEFGRKLDDMLLGGKNPQSERNTIPVTAGGDTENKTVEPEKGKATFNEEWY